jgi:hypothetical protein
VTSTTTHCLIGPGNLSGVTAGYHTDGTVGQVVKFGGGLFLEANNGTPTYQPRARHRRASMTDQTRIPGTNEWRQWVAEQKSSGLRDGPDHDATPEQAAEVWAAYEAQMAEEANQSQHAEASES